MADSNEPPDGEDDTVHTSRRQASHPSDAERDSNGGALSFIGKIFGARRDEVASAASLENGETRLSDLPKAKRDMVERVIAFDGKRVEDVMAPRADIVAVNINASLSDILAVFHKFGHSRMPIYRGNLDDPVGMVHIKDIVGLLAAPEEDPSLSEQPILKKLRRDVLFAPPSMPVTDLLLKMQRSRIHLALVVDEFGGTDGLATIEDLVEEIVGEIRDEHDDDVEPSVTPAGENVFSADARVEIEEFERATGLEVDRYDDWEDVDTLGGLVFALAGRVPQRGEVIAHPAGFDFEVVEADPRRIKKLRIYVRHASAPVVGETGAAP